jgi:protein TonB
MLLDDIVFRLKNKAYGAFLIRKKYRKTVVISLVLSIIIVFSLLTFQMFLDSKKQKTERLKLPPRIIAAELIKIDLDELKPKELEPPKKNDEKIPIPKFDKDSVVMADTSKTKPDTSKKIVKETILNQQEEDFSDAKFICGGNMLAFRMWFMDNFKYPDNPNIRKNEGRILLQFIVNTKGYVDSVSVISGIDPVIDVEAKHVLLSSPRWKPCVLEGKRLKQLYLFPVYLVKKN